jgi:anthranilate synthase component 1
VVATRTFVADALTPVRAYASLRQAAPDDASFLFESVVGGERWGRYSILGYRPRYEAVLDGRGWRIVSARELAEAPPPSIGKPGDPLAAAEALFRATEPRTPGNPAASLAHAHFGYLAWDLVHAIDKVPGWPAGESAAPLARFLGGATIVVFDALSQTVTVAADTEAEVDRATTDLSRAPTLSSIALPDRTDVPRNVAVDVDDAAFEAKVRRAQEYIAAGDAFQIVLARTFSVPRAGRDPFDVYRAMRLINPSPYMYFLDLPGLTPQAGTPGFTPQAGTPGGAASPGASRVQIMGASPETLVRLEEGVMTVRPIAGTRPRGKTEDLDRALEADLLADPKERAEHVMLIDLGRNDVGRVAQIGSVDLARKMDIERYSHVMHIVSEVRGKIADGTPPLEVVRAAFPAGTLSGAPKVRAMQIIRELEARPRGIYGGAVGYVAKTGDLDFAIAIRTAICRGDVFEVTAGAGIVEASVAKSEADETRNKARGVLCAIEAAPRSGS